MRQGAERSRLGARRPTRAEIEPAALELLKRHGAAIMATARRFAATPEDAEDAYQRGVEILLTKAPTTAEAELVPWLRTVVKHEAWALRRQRQRAAPVTDDGRVPERASDGGLTHTQAERLDRLRVGAQALKDLKPQEVRALVLRAEGHSYRQIQELTGWTYTKVNRCLTEGRKAFLARVAGIEAGSECERLAPLLSKLADGEATAEDLAALRPHFRTCLACRATLREFRGAPATAAALVPAAAFVASDSSLLDVPARLLEGIAGWTQKGHALAEMATAQKVAAVAASTAVIGGGAAVTVKQVERQREPVERAARVERRADASENASRVAAVAPAPTAVVSPSSSPAPRIRPRPTRTERRERRERAARRKTPPAQQEFEPAFAAATTPSSAAGADSSPSPRSTPATPEAGPAQPGGGAEEFAP
ncbi:MAG TPA: sigma-70 family RNA polymerase sigma factor [Thermoleophilaceae bacterium]|nr:sigma-70 family RNA polymerase sigma factor [Thermoleophilaceae bacterium]